MVVLVKAGELLVEEEEEGDVIAVEVIVDVIAKASVEVLKVIELE